MKYRPRYKLQFQNLTLSSIDRVYKNTVLFRTLLYSKTGFIKHSIVLKYCTQFCSEKSLFAKKKTPELFFLMFLKLQQISQKISKSEFYA